MSHNPTLVSNLKVFSIVSRSNIASPIARLLVVKTGEVIPIDGVVVKGRSGVDEQSLTGEPLSVPKQIDSLVWAGMPNIDGFISVQTTALVENLAVAKMAWLVEEEQNNRSKTQRLIDSRVK